MTDIKLRKTLDIELVLSIHIANLELYWFNGIW